MAIGDVAVMRVVGRYQLQNIVNTLYYQITEQSGDEVNQWQELTVDWENTVLTQWLLAHVDTYTLTGLKVFTKDATGVPPGFLTVGSPGSVVGISNDALVCRTITLYSGSENPRKRGRVQLSGGTTSMFDQATGQVTADEVTDLDALGAVLLTEINGINNKYKLVLWDKLSADSYDIVRANGRVTPSVVRSRRAKQFTIG